MLSVAVVRWLQLQFDADSTAVRLRSLRSRHSDVICQSRCYASRSHADLFIYLARSAYGRNKCRRLLVAQSIGRRTAVELQPSRIGVVVTALLSQLSDANRTARGHYDLSASS